MPGRLDVSPSLRQLASPPKDVPFVVPSRLRLLRQPATDSPIEQNHRRSQLTGFRQHDAREGMKVDTRKPNGWKRRCFSLDDTVTCQRQPRTVILRSSSFPATVPEVNDHKSPVPGGNDARYRPKTKFCPVMAIYSLTLAFQEQLVDDLQALESLWVWQRYRRLDALVLRATHSHRLNMLREAVRSPCLCAGPGEREERGENEPAVRKAGRLLGALLMAVRRVGSYLPSALGRRLKGVKQLQREEGVMLAATEGEMLAATESELLAATESELLAATEGETHGWQRRRLLALERHLVKLKQDYQSLHSRRLPLARYRCMRDGLSAVAKLTVVPTSPTNGHETGPSKMAEV